MDQKALMLSYNLLKSTALQAVALHLPSYARLRLVLVLPAVLGFRRKHLHKGSVFPESPWSTAELGAHRPTALLATYVTYSLGI